MGCGKQGFLESPLSPPQGGGNCGNLSEVDFTLKVFYGTSNKKV